MDSQFPGTIRVWNAQTGAHFSTLEGPSEGLEWMEWHPRGNLLLAGTEGGSVWLWNHNSQCLQVLTGLLS